MKAKEEKDGQEEKKSGLSLQECDQLRAWMKATPLQRLTWLEEAVQLAAKTKSAKWITVSIS
jgi:hypothetical protein